MQGLKKRIKIFTPISSNTVNSFNKKQEFIEIENGSKRKMTKVIIQNTRVYCRILIETIQKVKILTKYPTNNFNIFNFKEKTIMKKSTFLFAILIMALFTYNAEAQALKVPKAEIPTADLQKQLLGALDSVEGLGLSADQTSKLKANNKTFAGEIFKILGGSGSDDAKKGLLNNLGGQRQKFLTSLLGNDLLGKYTKKINGLIKPFKSKLGLASLLF